MRRLGHSVIAKALAALGVRVALIPRPPDGPHSPPAKAMALRVPAVFAESVDVIAKKRSA